MMQQVIEKDLWVEFEESMKEREMTLASNLDLTKADKNAHHKVFWDKFLTESFPQGQLNQVLEKNFAIWLMLNGVDLEQVKTRYKAQKWQVQPLLGWIKQVQGGKLKEYNPGEVMNWVKNNKPELKELVLSKEDDGILEKIKALTPVKLVWDNEIQSYSEGNVNWIIKKLIRQGYVNIIAGKRSSLKSWLGLTVGYCVASGTPFLGKFETEKAKVLYLDRENGLSELKIRDKLIKKGLELSDNAGMAFISETPLKIDNVADMKLIEDIIVKNDIKLLIIDTYRRVISFDENDAKLVSALYVDVLQPLCERTGLTIILLHHEKKGQSEGDEMDMIRGSSDFVNLAGGVLQVERKGDLLTVKQTKCRSGRELEPFVVKIETDETSFFKFEYKGEMEDKGTHIAKGLVTWLMENALSEFTYTQGLKFAEGRGWKKNSYGDALRQLETKGIIAKKDSTNFKSPYYVKNINLGGFE